MTKPEFYPIELLHWSGMQDKHQPMLEEILEAYPDYINTLNTQKDNALMIAIRVGNIGIMQYLLDKTNIDYKHVSPEGNFFMVALRYGNREIIQLILDKYNHLINFNDISQDGSFFMVALKYSSPETVKNIFNNYRHLIDFDAKNNKGQIFTHIAAKKGFDFIFEDISLLHHIHTKDSENQNCLFGIIDGYVSHKNFWCFDLIQEQLSNNEIKEKNIHELDVFRYFYQVKLIEFSTVKNPETDEHFISEQIKEKIIDVYAPIFNILEQRIENNF